VSAIGAPEGPVTITSPATGEFYSQNRVAIRVEFEGWLGQARCWNLGPVRLP